MAHYSEHDLWEQEQIFVKRKQKESPEKFIIPRVSRFALLKRVGINEDLPVLAEGYVKYSPLDFIVEEILENGTVVAADMGDGGPDPALAGSGTIYLDLLKVGISTVDAISRIAAALEIDPAKVGYAGMKDEVAITAQRISIEGSSLEAVKKLAAQELIPGVVLKNIWEGQGRIKVGSLSGNRFSLFIRTKEPLQPDDFARKVNGISERGVMNYYGLQRFGSPRFLSHLFGLQIFQGDIKGLIRSVLTEECVLEWPIMTELRREAGKKMGDWKAVRDIFSVLPYSFRIENALLDELHKISDSRDYHKAFTPISKQVDLWAKSYASYLTNSVLSEYSIGKIPITSKWLPLVISRDRKVAQIYGQYLKQDRTENYLNNLRLFPFIHVAHTAWIEPNIKPKFHGFKVLPEGVAISFDLVKGAYATTLLMNLFDIVEDLPIPDWVKAQDIDTKQVLATGSISAAREKLKVFINKVLEGRGQTTIND